MEAFLLAQPGLPAGLRQELHLLGGVASLDESSATGAGAHFSKVEVAGEPAVLVTDGSGIASGVVWQDGKGLVHAAAGLLDQKDILDVADQLG